MDSNHAWFLTFNDVCRSVGVPPVSHREFMRSVLGHSLQDECERYFPMLTPAWLSALSLQCIRRHLRRIRAFPDAAPVLRAVRAAGLRIAVVTNTPRRIAERVLAANGLRRAIDLLVPGDEVRRGKPHPAMARKACRRLGVRPADVVYIGDTPTDRRTAEAAHCAFVGLRTPSRRRVRRLGSLLQVIGIRERPLPRP